MEINNWILSIILIIIGYIIRLIFDYIKIPKLKIGELIGPFDIFIDGILYKAYRMKTLNKQNRLFNDAAN